MSDADATVLDGQLLHRDWPLPDPHATDSKDDRGIVTVIGGAASTPGAVMLAGLAALRVGAGKLVMGTVDRHASTVAVAIPEAGVTSLPASDSGSLGRAAVDDAVDLLADADAVLIGPGMLGRDGTRDLVGGLLPRLRDDSVLVLDALAATCGALADVRSAGLTAHRVIITPNVTEAEYLLDTSPVSADPPTARRLAERYGVTVVLGSVVAVPDGAAWHNLKGNSGLGTSGSGDVLAGAVTGIAARGASATQAALWGIHLHSTAGDRLARRIGPIGYLARELLDELPGSLHRPDEQP
jgi:hydroxyethylthiazole kinase-like uncharacterized protein yjeF